MHLYPIQSELMNFETGTYQIKFPDGTFYIGCSRKITKRLRSHLRQLQNGKHCNHLLSDAYRKSGGNVTMSRISQTDKYDLLFVEANQIAAWNSPLMLNISKNQKFPTLCRDLKEILG